MNTEIKKLEHSAVELRVEVAAEDFDRYINQALDRLRMQVKADGFRPRTVPRDLAAKKIGEEALLMEAGDLAVRDGYEKAIREHRLEPVSKPRVQITKLAKGNPFSFTLTVEVLPEVRLPDYWEIAAKTKGQDVSVDEKEVQDALRYLQKSRAAFSKKDAPAEPKDFVEIAYRNQHMNGGEEVKDRFILGEGGFREDFENQVAGMQEGEEKTFEAAMPENHPDKALAGKKTPFTVKMASVQRMDLPEINDEFAKALGAFDSLVALKASIREGIHSEKRESAKQRRRAQLLEQIVKHLDAELPGQMVAHEQERLFEQLKNRVARNAAMDFDAYLRKLKKTEAEVRQSLLEQAETRIKEFLALREIARREKLEAPAAELEEEMNKLLKSYPPEQARQIDIQQLREYAKDVVLNEKVFEKLESFSKITNNQETITKQ